MSLPEPFAYPIEPHERKHSPIGYAEYTQFKPWLRDEFSFRCVYCLQRETWSRAGMAAFSVDHIIPQSLDTNNLFVCDYSNLLYSCLRCNHSGKMILCWTQCVKGLVGTCVSRPMAQSLV